MKILQKGHVQRVDERPWWLRCKHTCPACQTVFRIEDGDDVDVITARTPNGESTATSKCPLCGHVVTTNRSTATMIVYRGAQEESDTIDTRKGGAADADL
jgi:rubredoxin